MLRNMTYKIKPTKRFIKLAVAAVFFSIVFVRYNQQRPALKEVRVSTVTQEEAPVLTAPVQTPQPDPKASTAVKRQLPATIAVEQKRYYLLDTPSDPLYSSSWYMQNINAPTAWNTTNNSGAVTIAVIDSGFALNHQDLTSQWKHNPGESGSGKEADGIDNDNNGYTDDYRGWDFVNNDNTPQAGTLAPSGAGVSHGTETAGLSGATSGNAVGVASVSRGATLLPLQVMDDNGNGFSDDVAQAIIYAIDQGASVINMSLGTNGDDPQVRSAINLAFAHNVIVVAAAGNCGNTNSGPCSGQTAGYVTFPANYNRVIAVGASDSTNNRASFSSYGERLDIMAPGSGSIPSTTWTSANGTSAYASSLYGTSYASPIVASSAALIRSIRPDTSIDDVRALLMGGSTKLGTMSGAFYTQTYGHGLLNIGKSIQIGSELNSSGVVTPLLQQVGGYSAEHIYNASDVLASNCAASALTWCTIWLRNNDTNYERFLPYTKTSSDGTASWSFTAAALNKGLWDTRARQGDIVSATQYPLYKK